MFLQAPLVPGKKSSARSGCPIAQALDLLGDRWTLLVVRDLIFYGRREFGEFAAAGERIASNILADRLERLVCAGLVERFDHPTDGKKYIYLVTERGLGLIPAMIELILWSVKHRPGTVVPPQRLRPLQSHRAAFSRELRQTRLAELKAARRSVRQNRAPNRHVL